ncbi:MAG: hypothetical protein CGU29_15195 [Candidatus Dactylopiibacterium carminicum]|uniref:GGDEF-domain containing protein n=1 Tax=Candidatus Dactylopiibacterium carminicum TaxID=857335 RepID=A0A272ENI6_9RHOO|nr:EAL domain-containing protein [Candidatus Dactylopiibacterium carminicum]KAF7600701.1 hypothetical protein BGI27_00900 [Candidatus Dactylopiibacterium carminicum]PAS91668.1 MAG: hypothetical protein CGU29_15195 [Candidatus Dactylopiibacterium carminicum]PAT00701.1 MAG: hypothetical protein BSR46_00900 [Candidatus Dactylopiibacterium carminicum]
MMTSPLISAYLVSVGILLMAGAHAAILACGRNHAAAKCLFAALCFGFAGFQFFNAMQNAAPDHASALAAHRWVGFFSILVIPLIGCATAALDTRRFPLRTMLALIAFSALAITYNFLTPYGYRFYKLAPDLMLTLPWGEHVWLIRGEPTLIYRLIRLVSLCVMIYMMQVVFSHAQLRDRLSRLLIGAGVAVLMVAALLAGMSDSGTLAIPYLGGFVFVFLAGAFSLLIRRELIRHALNEKRIERALHREARSRRLADARADRNLHTDTLTGLPNRAGFFLKLQALMAQGAHQDAMIVVLRLDIDRLGILKGTHGIATSDEALLKASQRLLDNIRNSDVLARTSNDGFALIGNHLADKAGIEAFRRKLGSIFEQAFDIGGHSLKLTACVGTAIFPDDALSATDLLAAAELALQDARSVGPNQQRSFRPELQEKLRQRIDLESALREALSRRQLFLCYQPQICADTSRTLAFEALIRWQHPEYGLVPPAHFIPLAEAIGLINPIGAWVVETACAQLAAWHRAGHRPLRMAVNLSARQLLDPTLENTILRALAETGLTPPDLELEITESVLIQDPKRTVERLLALRKLGLRLSIDDFGTGYSSLSYLRILPVHALKLDRSFVDEMDKDTISREICASTIRLAQRLQLEIVAEGVETETQAQQLRELGCPIFQGYLFSHPLGAEAAEQHLQHKRSSENPCLLPLNSGPATAVP